MFIGFDDNVMTVNKQSLKKQMSFEGNPLRITGIEVRNYQDALRWWEKLKNAKYLDVHSDMFSPSNKYIRECNYAFLDKLTTHNDKSQFIQKYCDFTKFPYLKRISDKIDSTFNSCVKEISSTLNSRSGVSCYDIVDTGYDPTSSIGLRKAFPGSDLDKGYIILEGNNPYVTDRQVVDNFKTAMWENLDQRIVSLNHHGNDMAVYTRAQVESIINKFDKILNSEQGKMSLSEGIKIILGITTVALLGPLALIAGVNADARKQKHKEETTDPYEAAQFNREFAKLLSNSKDRELAKNFAFFAETVKASYEQNRYNKNSDPIFNTILASQFVRSSNVTQNQAWLNKIKNGYLKSKLKNREQLENDFPLMTTDTKYELIKDVIKYSSEDQSSRFSMYFKNDDDIKSRYNRLLESLK